MYRYNVAIDGPTGAGKSTISREVSLRLGCIYVDTGAMYRTIGLYVLRQGVNSEDRDGILGCLKDIQLSIEHSDGGQSIFLNGEDVSEKIRTPEVSVYASNVSKLPEVRLFLLDLQRELAGSRSVLMDGRDIGSVVLPEADVKIFLTASDEERARRRYEELLERGQDVTFEQVLSDLVWRDRNDSGRETAPLKAADDAILLDTTGNTFLQSVDCIEKLIVGRLTEKFGEPPRV